MPATRTRHRVSSVWNKEAAMPLDKPYINIPGTTIFDEQYVTNQ